MIKAAFFDVDGTMYSHVTQCVSEGTRRVLDILREKGIKIFLATGRHFTELDDLSMADIPFDGYVMLTGQLCTDSDKNIIYDNPVNGKDAEYLFSAFINKEMPMMIVEKDKLYVNMANDVVVKGQEMISSPVPNVEEYNGAPVYQLVCYGGKEIDEELAKKIPNCKITRWSPYGVDIISKNGGKAAGIQKMLEFYGIEREEMIAFGDSENDLDMLQFAGIGVAMGNAEEEAKAAADYVTTDVDDNGIWNACKHFGLI